MREISLWLKWAVNFLSEMAQNRRTLLSTQRSSVSGARPLATIHQPPTTALKCSDQCLVTSDFRSAIRHLPLTTVLLVLATVLSHSPLLVAQTDFGAVTGFVSDPSGAAVPEATLHLVNIDTNTAWDTKTNRTGVFVFPSVKPGRYRMQVERDGFKVANLTGLTVNTQDHLEENFRLEVGSVSESVTVNSAATNDSPAVSLTVTRDFVENTPLNGRSFQDLLAMAPGAVSTGSGLYSINGQHDDANYFTVDGVAANVNTNPQALNGADLRGLSGTQPAQTALGTTQSLASVDALQEFKIQTSTYSAEYGRQPGGQVELTTRSGTNIPHGSLFDYFRNDALDANDWFFNHQGTRRQPERQNDFGGTLGGPLEIPRVYEGKDKTFFFVSYEGLRLVEPIFSGVQDVPTTAFRQFSAPTVQPYLNSTPLPTGPENGDQCALSASQTFSCTAQWSSAYSEPSDLHALNIRMDQSLGKRVQLFGRYSNVPSETTSYNLSEAHSNFNNTHSWTFGATVNAAHNMTYEFRGNYTASEGGLSVSPIALGGAIPYALDLISPSQYASPDMHAAGTPLNNFTGIPQSPDAFYIPEYSYQKGMQSQINMVDSVSIVRGSHSLKFGADFRRLSPEFENAPYGVVLVFGSLADYQQGTSGITEVSVTHHAKPVILNTSLYAEDHWKLSQRLTLDYGIRWEYNPPPGASDGIYPLALTSPNPAIAEIAPQGTPQYHSRHLNFAPRLGFAYSANSNPSHSLVIRGGVGIFHDTGQNLGLNGYDGYPFSASTLNFNEQTLPLTAAQLAPPDLTFPVNLTPPYGPLNGMNDPDLTLPYTEQWNLSLDHAIGSRNTVTASYVGNAGRRLLFTEDYFGGTLFDPNLTAAGLNYTSNASFSSYNALQLQDQGYLAPGMQLLVSYTWAHAIDNASSDLPANPPVRGNSDNDVRNVVNVAINYRIPAADSSTLTKALTRGWSADSRIEAQSGTPLNVLQGYYNLSNGALGPIIPDLVAGVKPYEHGVKDVLGGWALNSSAFSAVPLDPNTGAPLQQGDLGRNYLHGPAFWTLNMAMQRDFSLYDRLLLDFRVEAFNLINHPNAGNISTNLNSSTFGISNPGGSGGVPTIGVLNPLYASGAPRSLQLALKLKF